MNMPKRASCHHCMRRARLASSASELFCACGCAEPAAVFADVANVRSDAPVPTSQSRRAMRFDCMSNTPPVCLLKLPLRLPLENSVHEQPLFPWHGLLQRLLEF